MVKLKLWARALTQKNIRFYLFIKKFKRVLVVAGTRVYFRQVGGLSQTLATAHRVQSIVDYLHTVCVPPRDKHQHEHKHELCLTPVTHIVLVRTKQQLVTGHPCRATAIYTT